MDQKQNSWQIYVEQHASKSIPSSKLSLSVWNLSVSSSSRLSGIEDIVGERDQKLFKAVAQNEPIVSLQPDEEAPKKRGLLDVVKGFLPRRKEKKQRVKNRKLRKLQLR